MPSLAISSNLTHAVGRNVGGEEFGGDREEAP